MFGVRSGIGRESHMGADVTVQSETQAVMVMQPYVAPKRRATAFNCPRCGAFAKQDWHYFCTDGSVPNTGTTFGHSILAFYTDLEVSVCFNCREESLWFKGRLFYPNMAGVAPPNPDLSNDIKDDYLEAASIVQRSPRGAAALLRLCVEKLCKQLGLTGKDINDDIAELVKQGLPEEIKMALDTVRVTGNKAVHAGELDLKDDIATAMTLFGLVNIIADERISRKKRITAAYAMLPESERNKIDKRDKKQQQ